MATAFNSIALECATFHVSGTLTAGEPCKIVADKTVSLCASGNDFIGVVQHVRGRTATVAIRGFVTVPYSGNLPAVGRTPLVSNGSHGVTTGDAGTVRTVVWRDQSNKTVTFLL